LANVVGTTKGTSNAGVVTFTTLVIDGPSREYRIMFSANITNSTNFSVSTMSRPFFVNPHVTSLEISAFEIFEVGDEPFLIPPVVSLIADSSLSNDSRLIVNTSISSTDLELMEELTWVGNRTARPQNGRAVFDSLGAKAPSVYDPKTITLTCWITNALGEKLTASATVIVQFPNSEKTGSVLLRLTLISPADYDEGYVTGSNTYEVGEVLPTFTVQLFQHTLEKANSESRRTVYTVIRNLTECHFYSSACREVNGGVLHGQTTAAFTPLLTFKVSRQVGLFLQSYQ